ncbi:MAG: DUF4065 domain-containing protein [Clostridiales bacterium]|nr:DUF4065 domain-containing protein [Clostridiales bacterium]
MKEIFSENKLCICCMENHNVKTVLEDEYNIFKDVPVNYTAKYCYCDKANEFYADEKMTAANDIAMKDAYREKMELLTSKEIRSIRSKYGITQNDLCVLLGWGKKTITRYESHQVQDNAHDSILRKLDKDPEWFIDLLSKAKGSFSTEAYNKYLNTAASLYEQDGDQYLRKTIIAKYAPFYNNKIFNGNTHLSLDKVVDVIRYFSNSPLVKLLFKVKLMKMLWYGDTLAYKQRGEAITGLVYEALPMGAVPIAHNLIIDLKGVSYEEISLNDGTAYHFCKTNNETYPNLTPEEKQILDKIIDKLGSMSTNEIVSFMHKEDAYTQTKPRDIITYKYAKNLHI